MRQALRDKPLAIIDIETTGFLPEKHEIVEVAILRVQGKTAEMWATKIRPEHIETASSKALEINGYSPEAWESAMGISEAVVAIRERLKGCVIVGHNLAFDLGFIAEAYKRHSGRGMGFHYKLDTMALAYEHLASAGLNSLSLESVCNFLGVSNDGAHTAIADVERTYEVYRRLSRSSIFHRLFWRIRAAA